MSRVVAGRENDADTFIAFYNHTIIPLRAREIALLRLDHPGKDVARGACGSSAKLGDVDSEWFLSEETKETTFRLERNKGRAGHGDGQLMLRRLTDPTRHIVTAGFTDRAGELASELDRLRIPQNASRAAAATALRQAGIQARNADLAAAVKRRKECLKSPPPSDLGEMRSPDLSPATGASGTELAKPQATPVPDSGDSRDNSTSWPLSPPHPLIGGDGGQVPATTRRARTKTRHMRHPRLHRPPTRRRRTLPGLPPRRHRKNPAAGHTVTGPASRVMRARRTTQCPTCHGWIRPGQQIGHTRDGWSHCACILAGLRKLMQTPPQPSERDATATTD